MRGSRSRSNAFLDRHIMPRRSSPAAKSSSHGLMRGEPSFRSVPTRQSPSFRKRPSAGLASSGTSAMNRSQFIEPSRPKRQRRSPCSSGPSSAEQREGASDDDDDRHDQRCDHPRQAKPASDRKSTSLHSSY